MAAHVCTQLRDALVTALTGLFTTGENVFSARPETRVLQDDELPALMIYMGGEDVSEASLDGTMLERTQRMHIGLHVKGIGALDDTFNQMRLEIETALAPGLIVAGKRIPANYIALTDPELDANDQNVMAADMLLSFDLYTVLSAPDALLFA